MLKNANTRLVFPLFLAAVYGFLLLTRLVPTETADSLPKLFLTLTALELLVFALPAFFFCKVKGADYLKKLPLAPLPLRKWGFSLSLTLFLLFGGLFLNGLAYTLGLSDGSYAAGGSFILSEVSLKTNLLYVLFAYAALPAFCEEFLFRGILIAEYGKYGQLVTLLFSALASSFCFFDLPGFPSYFLTGFVLAFAVRVTGSVFSAMLMRFAVNVASIYLLPPLWNLMLQPLGNRFALLLSLFLLLFFLFFALKSSEKALNALARDAAHAADDWSAGKKKNFVRVFASPTFLGCVLLWLVASILRLVL